MAAAVEAAAGLTVGSEPEEFEASGKAENKSVSLSEPLFEALPVSATAAPDMLEIVPIWREPVES